MFREKNNENRKMCFVLVSKIFKKQQLMKRDTLREDRIKTIEIHSHAASILVYCVFLYDVHVVDKQIVFVLRTIATVRALVPLKPHVVALKQEPADV